MKTESQTPLTDGTWEHSKRSSEYCHGKDNKGAIWQDVACDMRDLCRKLERDKNDLSIAMSPLDRIAQLSEELRNAAETVASVSATRADLAAKASRLSAENAILRAEKEHKENCIANLRSQLADGQEQAKRDSATIKRLMTQGDIFRQDLKQFYAQ